MFPLPAEELVFFEEAIQGHLYNLEPAFFRSGYLGALVGHYEKRQCSWDKKTDVTCTSADFMSFSSQLCCFFCYSFRVL